MKRMRIAAWSAPVAVAALIAGTLFPAIPPLSGYFLTSEEELESLNALFADEAAWREIESLSEHMVLWRVSSMTREAPPDQGCLPLTRVDPPGEEIRHRFEFASRKGMSTRVFQLDLANCRRSEGGDYQVRVDRFGFGSSFALARGPLAMGVKPLRVLRLGLVDPEVSLVIGESLRDRDLAFCQVIENGSGEGGIELYRLILADGVPGEPGTTLVITFEVEYDGSRGIAVFSRLP